MHGSQLLELYSINKNSRTNKAQIPPRTAKKGDRYKR